MKIGFDATSLCRTITGIESYTLNLLENILKEDGGNNYVIFFRKEVHPRLAKFNNRAKFLVCPFNSQIFCEQIWLPYITRKEKVDLVHFPAFPPGFFSTSKFVFTIHDANIWKYPEMLSWKGRFYFRPLTIRGAKRAQKIITVSDSSKRDISLYTEKSGISIINAGEAVSPDFLIKTNEDMLKKIRSKYNLPDRFILAVNSIEPRKNINVLLDACKILNDKKKGLAYKLVLVGRLAWGKDVVTKKINDLGLQDNVNITGYIDSADLPYIYHMAKIFVYPSLYEGFGLPPLESMACGTPVIASDVSSLKETLGDAALFVKPEDPASIAALINELLENEAGRNDLIRKGLDRCNAFSWEKTAEKIIDVYKSIDFQNRVLILGVSIDNVTLTEALKIIEKAVIGRSNIYVTTPNTDHVMLFNKDTEFKKVYGEAALVVPDGMPIVWASKFLGMPLKERVCGSDLVPAICRLSAERGYKLFFLGGRPGAAAKAKENLEKEYPAIKINGVYSPTFDFDSNLEENNKITAMIKESKPDILFVGLGAPKQEKWIYEHYKILNIPVSIGVGATFEFISGMVRRAPRWMQKTGLEWFWRLLMEPKRLWKRYLIDDMKFFWLVLKQKAGYLD